MDHSDVYLIAGFLDCKCILYPKQIILLKKKSTQNSFAAIAKSCSLPSAPLEGSSYISISRTPLAVGLLSKEVAKSCQDRIGEKSSMRDRAYFIL